MIGKVSLVKKGPSNSMKGLKFVGSVYTCMFIWGVILLPITTLPLMLKYREYFVKG